MKKLRYLAIALAAIFVVSGCSIIKVNPERDGQQIVAVVNGENITKKEVYDSINLKWDTKIESWEVDTWKQKKEYGLESLIGQKVILQTAKDQGMYSFTDEEKKSIADTISSYTKSTYDAALAKYQEAAKTDSSIKPEEKANADVDEFLAKLGYTREKLEKEQQDSEAYAKLKKSVTDKVTVEDTDVKTQYDTDVTSQTTTYDATPAQAVTDENNGTTLVYYPEGLFRVRQILIPLTDDQRTEITNLRNDGSSDAATKADAKRDEYLKTIEAKANEYLTKAKEAGGDLTKLNALITESGNNDPGMDSSPDGYLMHKDATSYVKEFTAAAAALTDVGVPSALVGTDYGYHIIWISKKLTKGAVPYDEVKDKVKEKVLADKQDTAWNEAAQGYVDQFDKDKKITRYTDRLNN